MRKKIRSLSYRYAFIVTLILIMIFSNITIAQGRQLEILITDLFGDAINEINEKEHFKISILDFEQFDSPYLIDVNIEFNDIQFSIGESAEIILQAPEVELDQSFVISAFKDGFNSTNKTITILNKGSDIELLDLLVIPDVFTIKAGERFSVRVTDENGFAISGAEVAIQSFGNKEITNNDGRAWLVAPEDKEIITIIAQKDGYYKGTEKIGISLNRAWWQEFIENPYFPLFVGAIFLIFAIIFVNVRQKKLIYNRASEISKDKTIKKFDAELKENNPKSAGEFDTKETIRVRLDRDAKVEEIRISRSRKEKEVITVSSEDDEAEKIINKKKTQKNDYDWFEGTDDIRYEIDKLTGEIDENGIDKWYEGVDEIKEKIDEKMKKKKNEKKKAENG